MFARYLRTGWLSAVSVTTLGCVPARPVQPLRPVYPTILASAGYAGTMTATVAVDRTGHGRVIWPDTIDSGAPALFRQAIRRAVTRTAWHPARRWGWVRADTVRYEVAFVLLRDTLPLGENERYLLGNDTLPRVCPAGRSPRRVVVCATADRVRYSVVSERWPKDR